MFSCGYKSQLMDGQKEKFVRLEESSPRLSFASNATDKVNRCGFQVEYFGRGTKNPSKSVRNGMMHGSERLKSIGRSLRSGVSRAVFQEDLKKTEKKIFDPQDKFLMRMNRLFVISCILAVAVDPLFFYLPVIDDDNTCIGIDRNLAITTTTVRTLIDTFYLSRMALQFRTAYIAPSSRVFGRGELVIDPAQIAQRYLSRYFIVDFFSVLPFPQIAVWRFLHRAKGSDVLAMKNSILFVVFLQYMPRVMRLWPLTSELKRTAGVFAETAWAGAAYYLLWYMLASHIVGALWYLLSIERINDCWGAACAGFQGCDTNYLYCGNKHLPGYIQWRNIGRELVKEQCSLGEDTTFNYGIYARALESGVVYSMQFGSKFLYCLWWGLQNLRYLPD